MLPMAKAEHAENGEGRGSRWAWIGLSVILGLIGLGVLIDGLAHLGNWQEDEGQVSKVLAEGYSCLAPRYGLQIDEEALRVAFEEVLDEEYTLELLGAVSIWILDLTSDCHDHADTLEESIIEDGEDPRTHLQDLKEKVERFNRELR